MKLIPFSKEIHEKLAAYGYTHIEIREAISDEYLAGDEHKNVQVFKALDRIDTMPASANIVPLSSKTIDKYLSNKKLNCYIVVQAKDIF